MASDMWAEAILLATMAPPDVLLRVKTRYMKEQASNLHRVCGSRQGGGQGWVGGTNTPGAQLLGMVAAQEWQAVVNSTRLENWKEAFVVICTYAPDATMPNLCGVYLTPA